MKNSKKSDNKKIKILENIIQDIFWMARRYANGRHTFSPNTIRTIYKTLKKDFPNIKIQHDITINPPEDADVCASTFRTDYLYDINEDL